jgi:hypothetical protein
MSTSRVRQCTVPITEDRRTSQSPMRIRSNRCRTQCCRVPATRAFLRSAAQLCCACQRGVRVVSGLPDDVMRGYATTLCPRSGGESAACSALRGLDVSSSLSDRRSVQMLLDSIGFVNIKVTSQDSDGQELESLVRDFAHACLLPFLHQVPLARRKLFREEFLRHTSRSRTRLYEHWLFATARHPSAF